VIDRANLRSILAEHKLSEEGLTNPETAKQLGRFANVDAILIGTITALDSDMVLTVKAISTETAEIVAASKTTITRTKEIQQFSIRSVPSVSAGASMQSRSAATIATLATKDFGDLRVVLKNIQPTTTSTYQGPVKGLRFLLEFSNRNLRSPSYLRRTES
jgi:hypothetical protein